MYFRQESRAFRRSLRLRLQTLVIVLFVAAICAIAEGYSPSGDVPPNPVLLELFTSEGCSTCPPADAFVQRMDSGQPIPGAQLIVLSEHVDYWDHDGWKDPYSSHSLTIRQENYVHALGLNEPYTPQIIMDGRAVLDGDSRRIQKMLADAATAPKLAVRISSLNSDPAAVHARVDVAGGSVKRRAEILAAVVLDHAESEVLRGENSGKHLEHVAVVVEMKKVGEIEKGKGFSQEVQLKLKPGTDPKNIRLIVFVQESGPGKVLGAAMQRAEK